MKRLLRLMLLITTCTLSTNNVLYSAEEPLIRVLILTGQHNHDWQKTTPLLSQILQQSGRFSVSVLNDPNQIDASWMKFFDVVIINWLSWPNTSGNRWNMVTENAISDFVRKGKGLAVFHAASMSHQDWPEYQKMTGVTWDPDKSGNSEVHAFKVVVKNKQHPVTRDMVDFWIKDELIHKMRLQPNAQVLCSANSAKDKKGSGKDEPVIICSTYGEGRCFNHVLGHDTSAMRNIAWKTLMLRGIEWAATGQVTIPIPNIWPEWQQDSETTDYSSVEGFDLVQD